MNIIKKISAIVVVLLFVACNADKKDKAVVDKKEDQIQALKPVDAQYGTISEEDKSSTAFNNRFISTDTTTRRLSDQQEAKQQIPKQKNNPDWDHKIIKTADLEIEVKDYNKYASGIREKIRSLGGYIAQEQQSESDYKIQNTVTVKVPVDQFDNAVSLVTTEVIKVVEKKISSQDVTGEYVDTRSRLESKKQVRLRYLDLLKQARNMEEILSVQSEIDQIQEEIESAAGRIEFLGHSSSFSTIIINYYQVLNASAKTNDHPSFGKKVMAAFKDGWSWIGEFFVGVVTIWPLFLLAFLLVILYKKWAIQKRRAPLEMSMELEKKSEQPL